MDSLVNSINCRINNPNPNVFQKIGEEESLPYWFYVVGTNDTKIWKTKQKTEKKIAIQRFSKNIVVKSFTYYSVQFSSVQSLRRVQLFATLWITARQASPSITNSRSSLRLVFIESVMPSSHLILGRSLLLLPPTPPSIRVFSNESTLPMRWPKYWSFSFSIIPSKEIPGLISFRMD